MIMDDREALILSWMNRALNAEENLDTAMAANVKLDARYLLSWHMQLHFGRY